MRDRCELRFNPRPAQSSGATPMTARNPSGVDAVFQSAPRSVERGDRRRSPQAHGSTVSFNPRPAQSSGATRSQCSRHPRREVSIRAPLSRAGRPSAMTVSRSVHQRVSIRAPLSRAGRPWYVDACRESDRGFNPRPAQSSGATCGLRGHDIATRRFQSAPRSVERGDVTASEVDACASVFQSAPRSVERGDSLRRSCNWL